ncbi:MAG: methyltransferase domain-containing protein [Phycisphaerae bacterium]|nr:methyltransferase domain-containing protein [Phycisphaerae bacterium]
MLYEREFAHIYDFIVHDKEEALAEKRELAFIQWAFQQGPRHLREILDIGCGKGRYLIPLAQAGNKVVGLDNSSEMLEDCRLRLHKRGLQADLFLADFETLNFDQSFDAVICMNSVICYLLETQRILSALTRFRQALRPKGILVLDIWNILAQWELFGKSTSHHFENESIRIEWSESYEYENFTSIFRGKYWGQFVENGVTHQFHREEILRAMTAGEMKMYLKTAGFINVMAFADYNCSEYGCDNAEVMAFVAFRG